MFRDAQLRCSGSWSAAESGEDAETDYISSCPSPFSHPVSTRLWRGCLQAFLPQASRFHCSTDLNFDFRCVLSSLMPPSCLLHLGAPMPAKGGVFRKRCNLICTLRT